MWILLVILVKFLLVPNIADLSKLSWTLVLTFCILTSMAQKITSLRPMVLLSTLLRKGTRFPSLKPKLISQLTFWDRLQILSNPDQYSKSSWACIIQLSLSLSCPIWKKILSFIPSCLSGVNGVLGRIHKGIVQGWWIELDTTKRLNWTDGCSYLSATDGKIVTWSYITLML